MKSKRNPRGCISPQGPKRYILSQKLGIISGARGEVRQNLRGGISPEKPKLCF